MNQMHQGCQLVSVKFHARQDILVLGCVGEHSVIDDEGEQVP